MSINIKLIKESFRAIRPHSVEVVEHFYEELLNKFPETNSFFSEININKYHKVLTNSLAHIVEFLDETDHLKDYLRNIGTSQMKYGVLPEHYSNIREALLTTFEFYFEENWTTELKNSWNLVFEFIGKELTDSSSSKTDNVVAINNSIRELNIHEIAKKFSHDLILKSMNEELANSDWEKYVQEKISGVIKKAIEDEVKAVLKETLFNEKSA